MTRPPLWCVHALSRVGDNNADDSRTRQVMGGQKQSRNAAQDVKGKVKEAAGKATGNDRIKNKGKTDQKKAASRRGARR